MARLLVHVVTGPENPTRAALGLLVARTAADDGHEVEVFLAGDAVSLLRAQTANATAGVGTGNVAEHLGALRQAGITLHASGMSSQARGIQADEAQGVELCKPNRLVELAVWAEKTLTY